MLKSEEMCEAISFKLIKGRTIRKVMGGGAKPKPKNLFPEKN
jgi:hypothetical protein